MSEYVIPAGIMFFITVGFSSLFLFPAVRFSYANKVVQFYWVGFWAFLGGIMALSGGQAVLVILEMEVEDTGQRFLIGVTASFIFFVMFAWARLSLQGARGLVRKVRD